MVEQDTNQHEQEVHLLDYVRVLRKRKWIIVTCFVLVVMVTAYATLTQTPIYRATTKIVIEKKNPNVVSVEEVFAMDATSTDYYQTQYEILKSRTIARGVVERLDLENSQAFNPPPKDDPVSRGKRYVAGLLTDLKEQVVSFVFPSSGEAGGVRYPVSDVQDGIEERESALINRFLGSLSIEPVRETRMVQIHFDSPSPVLAARVADSVARVYMDQNLETKMKTIKHAVQWLKERLEEERLKVEAAQKDFLKYRELQGIITDISPETETVRAQKLAGLKDKIVEAETDRIEAESKYTQARKALENGIGVGSIPSIATNQVISSIKDSEMELSSRLSELSEKYGAKHPRIIALKGQLAELKRRKQNEVKKLVQSLKHQYETALSRERSLKSTLGEEERKAIEMNRKGVQYGVLKRKAETAKEMYDLLVKRFKEASLTEDIKTVNVRVVDPAETPRSPIKPEKKRNMLLAMVLGLFLGGGLAFFSEYLDDTLKTPEEVKSLIGLPFLGMIPKIKKSQESIELTVKNDPKSMASEAFRSLRTNVLFSSADQTPRVLLISSSLPEEGKTSTAVNLATAMAQAGSKTVLLGCDMRKPTVHKVFGFSREEGLSNCLTGSLEVGQACLPTGVDNLDLIPSGPIPPNPSELLGSQGMSGLLETLKENYERIVIDSPPLTAVTDASLLAQKADGVILVVRAFVTSKQAVKAGLEQLRNVGAKILGVAFNSIDMDKEGAYYSSYYYAADGKKKRKKRGKAA
ncbi:MAG: polysaccharide biosynthesis tyrosine autokinase [Desulfohalobiaceae bacterium]|nr:polysaccharide biosynthesis tyrosine autokinase [Desulfohalobiaceae bacterium]